MAAVPVPEDLVARLRRRARLDGIPEEQLVERALRGFLDQDPYEFFEAGSSDLLRGDRVNQRLEQTGFGRPRS